MRRLAFTLIELLVVVAIIALLMSVLLPALSRARESAKSVKCVSNMRQIGTAMHMYFNEFGEWFPFARDEWRSPYYQHGLYYGGHPGRQSPAQPGEWWGYTDPFIRDTPAGRPFNRYLYSDLPKYDVQPTDPQFEIVRNLPVYECPSDVGGAWNVESNGYVDWNHSEYRYTGTSYTPNYQFVKYWAFKYFVDRNDYRPWMHQANAVIRDKLRRDAAHFVMLYEDNMDYGLWMRTARFGWHKRSKYHTLMFLDGHSAHMFVDTEHGPRGNGWHTDSPTHDYAYAFWTNPDDPDYRYRDLDPLP